MKSILAIAFVFVASVAGAGEPSCANKVATKSDMTSALTAPPIPDCTTDVQCPGHQKCLAGRCVGGLIEDSAARPLASGK